MAKLKANFTLTRAIKRKWLEMLRSGEFEQTKYELKNDHGFCCLGLLCLAAGIPEDKLGGNELPQQVGLRYAGQPDEDCQAWMVPYKGELTVLSELNDMCGLSFSNIADIVQSRVGTH